MTPEDALGFLSPSDIGLILSYHCLAGCAHCVYNCGPNREGWMQPEDIRTALESMQVWQHPFQVHITGGEPFLNFPLLLHAVEIAVELGIPVYVETNASWCVREALVEERFQVLRRAGLLAVLISCSPFHTETIPLERTQLALRKAVDVFGEERVLLYQAQWMQLLSRFDTRDKIPLNDLESMWGRGRLGDLLWNGFGLMGGGRCGVRLGDLITGRGIEAFRGEACRRELLYAPHSHFDLYGNYVPGFCGGISLGSWRDLPDLQSPAERGELSFVLQTLVESGPCGLLDRAVEAGFHPDPAGYADKCHLCVEIRRSLTELGDYEELKPSEFYSSF